MIESVTFRNFKVLRNTTLPLGPFTLIVGPNGSGKSTAIDALEGAFHGRLTPQGAITAGLNPLKEEVVVSVRWGPPLQGVISTARGKPPFAFSCDHQPMLNQDQSINVTTALTGIRIFSFDATALAAPVTLKPNALLQPNGANLAGVLDRLRDKEPERFETLNGELSRWIPEFDRILFDNPSDGARSFSLRTQDGKHAIKASDLSHGTLLALAILTLSYLPESASLVCIEEPDRGIHPRLLRNVRDALYRLAYPSEYGEKRAPIQVVVTTHSPYLLDLYKDEPDGVVIAQKGEQGTTFKRLSDLPNIEEILRDGHLGDVWYSGILGGVPAHS